MSADEKAHVVILISVLGMVLILGWCVWMAGTPARVAAAVTAPLVVLVAVVALAL